MVKIKDTQFCVKNLKMKRRKDKNILTFRSGDSYTRFSVIFLPMIWIFKEAVGDEIRVTRSNLGRKLRFLDFTLSESNFHQIWWGCKAKQKHVRTANFCKIFWIKRLQKMLPPTLMNLNIHTYIVVEQRGRFY